MEGDCYFTERPANGFVTPSGGWVQTLIHLLPDSTGLFIGPPRTQGCSGALVKCDSRGWAQYNSRITVTFRFMMSYVVNVTLIEAG